MKSVNSMIVSDVEPIQTIFAASVTWVIEYFGIRSTDYIHTGDIFRHDKKLSFTSIHPYLFCRSVLVFIRLGQSGNARFPKSSLEYAVVIE
jgi:hypothetical protein